MATALTLDLKTFDWLRVERPVELEGTFFGTIEADDDRFTGLGGVIIRVQPRVGARMRVGDVVLEARHRNSETDNVWNEAVPRQKGT